MQHESFRVLVADAATTVGRRLVTYLAGTEYDVRALVTDPADEHTAARAGADDVAIADMTRTGPLESAVSDVDAICCTVSHALREYLLGSVTAGTRVRNLLAAAADATPYVVLHSRIGVGDSSPGMSLPVRLLTYRVRRALDTTERYLRETDLPHTILRTGRIVTPTSATDCTDPQTTRTDGDVASRDWTDRWRRGTTDRGTRGTTDRARRDAPEEGTWSATDRGTRGSTDRGTRGSTDRGTRGSTDRGTRGSTDHGTRGSTDRGTRGPMDAADRASGRDTANSRRGSPVDAHENRSADEFTLELDDVGRDGERRIGIGDDDTTDPGRPSDAGDPASRDAGDSRPPSNPSLVDPTCPHEVVTAEGGDTVAGRIDRDDLAWLLAAALTTPEARNRTFEVVDVAAATCKDTVDFRWRGPESGFVARRTGYSIPS